MKGVPFVNRRYTKAERGTFFVKNGVEPPRINICWVPPGLQPGQDNFKRCPKSCFSFFEEDPSNSDLTQGKSVLS